VDVASIGATVNALIGGMPISKYTENGRRYDVRIRLAPLERATTGDIDRLQVWNNRGELEELRNVVTVVEEPTSPTITRRNRERAVTIDANVAPGKSQTAAMREIERLAARILPPGYRIVFSGSAQTFKESFASLMFVLLMGILVSYMVLASQFNSYLHPFIVLLALPFSVAGALIALWAGGQSINIYSFIGIILLMGIVKKNSILLVDFTNQYRRTGAGVHDALVAAGPVRLRPILMTSLATIVAALPPALAIGPGAETRIPMAIAVIGGVIFSTLLTLLVIPCAYRITARETMLSSDDLSKQ
jgi:HAE1 family hydrophobic/amphiphilic exporter-1